LCRFADARLSSPEHPQRQRLEEAASYSPGTAIVAGAFFLSRICCGFSPRSLMAAEAFSHYGWQQSALQFCLKWFAN
jgi:hypothetical protein